MRKKMLLSVFALAFVFITGHAQTTAVTGKVIDEKGLPVSGASILERGTKGNGTTSATDGSFSLKVKPGATLMVSAIGFETFSVPATAKIGVTLRPEIASLSEVIVTGVGAATSKKKVGISNTTVGLANEVKVPTGDVAQQLVGQVPGAQISSTNGSPGARLNILFRGINSIQGGTYPMILMDGVEIRATDLNSIDLNIVDRVEIVEGAAAATLYGAQGANGVIQLFTKKAKLGKINIDFSSSASTNSLLNIGNLHKAYNHAFVTDASNNAILTSGVPLALDPATLSYNGNVQYNALSVTSYANKPYGQGNLQYYDHFKEFLLNGYALNNSVTISGSRDRMNFLLSASNNAQNSNFKDNGDYQRSNLTSKIEVELLKNLKFSSLTQVIYTKNTLNDQTGRTVFYSLNNSRPFANYQQRDLDGTYGIYYGDAVGVNGTNPNYQNMYSSTLIGTVNVAQNFNLNYRPVRFLELDVKYGLDYKAQNITYRYEDEEYNKNAVAQNVAWGPNTGAALLKGTGGLYYYDRRTTFQNFIGTANIRTDFDKDFHLKVPIKTVTTLAFDYRKNYYRSLYYYGTDAPPYYPWNVTQTANYKIATDYVEPFITYGFLANQRFEWGDLAGVTIGVRSDYSSAFGSGATAQTFPRGDAYLNVSKFKFWEGTSLSNVIADFKIRAAYGEAGIQPGAFQRFPVLGAANLGANSVFTFPTTSPNPNLAVELSKEKEIGTDIGLSLLKGSWLRSAAISFTYWKKSTDNAIYSVDAAPSTGVGTVLNNAFGLSSHGVSASLNLQLLSSKDFTWDMITNFSKQTSIISSITGPDVVVTSNAGSSGLVLKAGQKVGQLFGYLLAKTVDQLDPNGNPIIPKASQSAYEVASNGYVVNSATKQPVGTSALYSFGDPNPLFNMSFINNFTYKGFLSLSMQWDWVNGSHLYNQTKEWMYRDGIHGDYDNPITIAGQTQAYTAFYRGIYQVGANNGTKDYFYEDASFMRLRNVSAAVDFAKLFKLKGFQRLQLVLSGRNLVTFTKYTGMDPEVSSGTSNSAFDRGVDHNTIPNQRSYTVGVNIGF